MNVEEFRDYALSLPYTTEKMPFDDKVLVFYVGGKVFALSNIVDFEFITVKCAPEKAIELRRKYEEVQPGYHMNKKHWNSLYLSGSLTDTQIKKWIKESYELVLGALSKTKRLELALE